MESKKAIKTVRMNRTRSYNTTFTHSYIAQSSVNYNIARYQRYKKAKFIPKEFDPILLEYMSKLHVLTSFELYMAADTVRAILDVCLQKKARTDYEAR